MFCRKSLSSEKPMNMSKARGLFDEQIRLEKLSKKQDPLERLSSYIDFEYFRGALEKALVKGGDKSKGGRPAYDVVLMFKILILQRYYNVSDDAIEYAILDRLSFMRFLGLGINDTVPDSKTIWLFRDTLMKKKLVDQLFSALDKQLDKDGVIVHKGKILDASIVEVPIQRNNRKENGEIKDGNTPDEWSDNKKRQKDTDAQWTRKHFQNYFGYKNHIKVDSQTKLITGFKVTSANISDKHVVDDLLDNKEDGGQPLYGDTAYSSKELEELYARKKIISRVNQKGYRNKKITGKQRKQNKIKSKVRARVEHVFGFMANSMKAKILKYRSLIRNQVAIGLINLTYNLFRLVQLNIELRK
jgi:transposase, IS5 family